MSVTDNNNDFGLPQRQEEFVSLFFASQTRILSFILSLVPNFNDGEDLLQEVWNIMWRKFDQYERGTDFAAWGKKVAYYLIMDYRRKQSLKHVIVNDQLFGIISEKASEYLEKLNTKIQRISLSQKTRDVNITCYSRATMLELESLSGGEQVSIALSLRLGMAHLLGSSNLNFMGNARQGFSHCANIIQSSNPR